MSELKREEFATAVAETVEAVRGLYQESRLLLKEIGEQLSELEESLNGRTPARPKIKESDGEYLPSWMGQLYWPSESADSQDDDPGEDGEDETGGKPGHDVTLGAEPVAFAKLVLYRPHTTDFEPHLLYGVLTKPRLTDTAELADGRPFTIGSMKVRKILVGIDENTKEELPTKAAAKAAKGGGRKPKGQGWLSFTVPEPPRRKALHAVAGPGDAREVAEELRQMWSKAAAGAPAH